MLGTQIKLFSDIQGLDYYHQYQFLTCIIKPVHEILLLISKLVFTAGSGAKA